MPRRDCYKPGTEHDLSGQRPRPIGTASTPLEESRCWCGWWRELHKASRQRCGGGVAQDPRRKGQKFTTGRSVLPECSEASGSLEASTLENGTEDLATSAALDRWCGGTRWHQLLAPQEAGAATTGIEVQGPLEANQNVRFNDALGLESQARR